MYVVAWRKTCLKTKICDNSVFYCTTVRFFLYFRTFCRQNKKLIGLHRQNDRNHFSFHSVHSTNLFHDSLSYAEKLLINFHPRTFVNNYFPADCTSSKIYNYSKCKIWSICNSGGSIIYMNVEIQIPQYFHQEKFSSLHCTISTKTFQFIVPLLNFPETLHTSRQIQSNEEYSEFEVCEVEPSRNSDITENPIFSRLVKGVKTSEFRGISLWKMDHPKCTGMNFVFILLASSQK